MQVEKGNKNDTSKLYGAGSIWRRYNSGSIIERIIERELGKTKVRMTNGQVFSKIFLSRYYKRIL